MTTTTTRRSRLTADAYWYLSPAASRSIDAVIEADGRRSWDPRYDSPSLATLQGRARTYGGHYERSRTRLLRQAGVRVRSLVERRAGRLVWVVTRPGEPLAAAVQVDRATRRLQAAN